MSKPIEQENVETLDDHDDLDYDCPECGRARSFSWDYGTTEDYGFGERTFRVRKCIGCGFSDDEIEYLDVDDQ